MLRVALRTLRFRKGAFIATFLAMTFGARRSSWPAAA